MSLSFEGVSNLLPYLKVQSSLMLHFMCYDYCSKNYEDTVKINENDHRRIFFQLFSSVCTVSTLFIEVCYRIAC